MNDGPIDINKNKKEAEKTQDLQVSLFHIFQVVMEKQLTLETRIEDLRRDQTDLVMKIEETIKFLVDKYPELELELEDVDFES